MNTEAAPPRSTEAAPPLTDASSLRLSDASSLRLSDASSPRLSDCTDTTAEWGAVCDSCHQRLPANRGPLQSERARMSNEDFQRRRITQDWDY